MRLSDSSWREKDTVCYTQLFQKIFISVAGILSVSQQDTIPCCRGEGRLHLFALET